MRSNSCRRPSSRPAPPSHAGRPRASRSRVRAAAAAVPAVLAAGLLAAACGDGTGVVDAGEARKVVPPPTAQPLWSDQAAPVPPREPAATQAPGATTPERPAPTPVKVAVPAGDDARGLDTRAVLLADPLVDTDARAEVRRCPDACGLRPPVYRDLTGDGRPELIASVTDRRGGTGTYAYTVVGGQVFDIFWYFGDHYAVDGLGEDLVVRQAVAAPGDARDNPSLLYRTRFRWNGREMEPIGTETEFRQQPPLVPNGGSPSASSSATTPGGNR